MSFTTRRRFLGTATKLAAAVSSGLAIPFSVSDADSLEDWLASEGSSSLADPRPDDVVARDETYWARVRALYTLDKDVLNFDHGWTNPAPAAAVDELARKARLLEALPAEHLPGMWEGVSTTKLRAALASIMSVSPDEISLLRNATEALDTVLLGFPLEPGDEIVCSVHDYYAMIDALHQRRLRDRVVLRTIEPPIPASLGSIETLYATAIGERTRLVLLTHPSNLTGQLLPVQRIAAMAHAVGAKVVVDGAQSLGVLADPVLSLGCDFYGASAHKWLGAPVGLGVLWMKTELMQSVWPLIPSPAEEKGRARFEWIGTAPEYINVASLPALAVHDQIGAERKAARLRYLATIFRDSLSKRLPGVKFYASSPAMTLGLTTFEIDGVDSAKLQQGLRNKQNILVQAMTGIRSDPRIRGIRVSPNVYSTPAEVERVVRAITVESRSARAT
ncbi:MAG: aminotransferase class V-fold PLP-dependent enzyme [Gemmatimonadaceae bacterium]